MLDFSDKKSQFFKKTVAFHIKKVYNSNIQAVFRLDHEFYPLERKIII